MSEKDTENVNENLFLETLPAIIYTCKNQEDFAVTSYISQNVELETGYQSGLRTNGEQFPALASISRLEFESETILTIVLWDISEYKKTELPLNQFKTTLDKTLDCVFMFDPKTLKFFYVNQGAMNQIGYTEKELFNMTPMDIKPEFTETQFRQAMPRC